MLVTPDRSVGLVVGRRNE